MKFLKFILQMVIKRDRMVPKMGQEGERPWSWRAPSAPGCGS